MAYKALHKKVIEVKLSQCTTKPTIRPVRPKKERKKERKKYFRQRESIEQYMSRNVRINTFGHMSPVKVQIRLRIRIHSGYVQIQ